MGFVSKNLLVKSETRDPQFLGTAQASMWASVITGWLKGIRKACFVLIPI